MRAQAMLERQLLAQHSWLRELCGTADATLQQSKCMGPQPASLACCYPSQLPTHCETLLPPQQAPVHHMATTSCSKGMHGQAMLSTQLLAQHS